MSGQRRALLEGGREGGGQGGGRKRETKRREGRRVEDGEEKTEREGGMEEAGGREVEYCTINFREEPHLIVLAFTVQGISQQ